MSSAVSMADQRRRKNRLLVLEVIKVLRAMGGSAHADVIVQTLASRRRQQGREAPDTIAKSVRDVLHLFENAGDESAVDRPVFHRPFGPDSQRWSLRHDAIGSQLSLNVIEEVEAILSDNAVSPRSPDGIEAARRRVLDMLGDGSRCAPVDLMVLDELERRGKDARQRVRH